MHNIGQAGGVPDADIDAPEAWDTLNSASNIIVAVIDSGALLTHQDLAANLWVNPGEIANNGLDDDGNGIIDDIHGINAVVNSGNPTDDFGHGTHVTGIVGAVGNNGAGVSGVAWRIQLMSCKFLTSNGGSESDLLQCLDYARTNGAKVVNCSFVAPTATLNLSNAFRNLRNAGIIVTAAAGNHGATTGTGVNIDSEPYYPASFDMDNIVSVTATTRTDGFSGYNYGPNSVHLGAPGSSIWSTYNRTSEDYIEVSGTSMSVPCVSGAVALLWARFPSFDHRQIISRLLNTVDPLPSLVGRCRTGGRLNLGRALGSRDYFIQPAQFDWVPTNGMVPVVLAGDSVSGPLALSFPFNFFGSPHTELYVGANGVVGFHTNGLELSANMDLPNPSEPNDFLSPYWDDLNPSAGGSVWIGTLGLAPNRKVVISWVDVPHADTGSGPTPFTFQVVLHESREITYQYLQVESGKNTLISGKSATIGAEDYTGQTAIKYLFNGIPSLVTNRQSLLMAPQANPLVPPSLTGTFGPGADQFHLSVFGHPGKTYVLSVSQDFQTWTSLATNSLPGSGLWHYPDNTFIGGATRFFRASAVE